MAAWKWSIGTIIDRDGKHEIVVKKKGVFVFLMRIDYDKHELQPWSRRMRIDEFEFMVRRRAYRYIGWLRLGTKERRLAIKKQLDRDFPENFKKMEQFT